MDWREAFDLGVPTALLVMVGFAIWRAGVWFAPRIERIITVHLDLIETMRREQPKQTEILSRLAENQQRVIAWLEERKPTPPT